MIPHLSVAWDASVSHQDLPWQSLSSWATSSSPLNAWPVTPENVIADGPPTC